MGQKDLTSPPYNNCITSHSPPRHRAPPDQGVECRKAAIALQMWRPFFVGIAVFTLPPPA
jgi:hypothetical protein